MAMIMVHMRRMGRGGAALGGGGVEGVGVGAKGGLGGLVELAGAEGAGPA